MNLIFTITQDEANLVGAALGKLPFETVSLLIKKLQTQVDEQLKPTPVETET